MAEEVEWLVIAPFREIVGKARTAIENTEGADERVSAPMLKAAQSLQKEGERALKRIEPLCAKKNEEFGTSFIDAIKENVGIADYRSELDDLLWDFDEYVEADRFDGEKFDELQKASRRVAPKVLDILKRMKLVAPALMPIPALAPLQAVKAVSPDPFSASMPREGPSVVVDPSSASDETMIAVEQQLSDMMGAQAGPDQGLDGAAAQPTNILDRSNSNRSEVSEGLSDPEPRPPSTNPWDAGNPYLPSPSEQSEGWEQVERRPPVWTGDSPALPFIYPLLSQGIGSRTQHSPAPSQSSVYSNSDTIHGQMSRLRAGSSPPLVNGNETSRHSSLVSDHASNASMRPSRPPSNASSLNLAHPSPAIPENSAVNSLTHANGSITNLPPRQTSLSSTQSHPVCQQQSTDSFNSSIFDFVQNEGGSSPVASTQRTSSVMSAPPSSPYSPVGQPPQYTPHPIVYKNRPVSANFSGTIASHSSTTITPRPQAQVQPLPAIETVTPPALPEGTEEAGLIPVETETPEGHTMPLRQPDISIGPRSSFYQMKGFCKGAEEAARGEPGFKKIKKPVGGYTMTMSVVAKCNHCLFELDYKAVEMDMKNDSRCNFISSGVKFRLRFLQKSHLHMKHIEEQLFGCVLCIQAGHTIEESDATVFFNQKQLFTHMARHPRPLPVVSGFTIFDGPELPRQAKDNYDIVLPNPPLQSIMNGLSREIGMLPSAVATETRKNANGILRTPPDRGAVLQLSVGSRIVGIEFPARYKGKWGIGWHDGVRAAFEADAVRLDAPPRNEVPVQGTSNMQALARWKWHQSGDGNWLKFAKGDTIKNISWAYTDHWCWAGTSSKGWGIFPQSHIEPNSVRETQPGDGTSVNSAEKKTVLSRFSLRKVDRKTSSIISNHDAGSRMYSF